MTSTEKIEKVTRYLQDLGLGQVAHFKQSFLNHLVQTRDILAQWNESEEVQLAGLCHSIYGTEFFREKSVPESKRSQIAELIGPKAERLAYLFCVCIRESFFDNTQKAEDFKAFNRVTGILESISEWELRGLLAISLANELEQRPRQGALKTSAFKNLFLESKRFLSEPAFQQFIKDYQVSENGDKTIILLGSPSLKTSLSTALEAAGYRAKVLRKNEVVDEPAFAVIDLGDKEPSWYTQNLEKLKNLTDFYILLSSFTVYSGSGEHKESSFAPSPNQIQEGHLPQTRELLVNQAGFKRSIIIRAGKVLDRHGLNQAYAEHVRSLMVADEILVSEEAIVPPFLEKNDLANFICWALRSDLNGPVNACSEGQMSQSEFFQRLAKGFYPKPQIKIQKTKSSSALKMNCEKVNTAGYRFQALESWLPATLEMIHRPQLYAR